MAYPSLTDALMAAQRRSQLTGRKLANRDIAGIASGYFDTSYDRTMNARRLALGEQELRNRESQFADTLAQQKAEMEAQKDAAGKATKQGYVNTGVGALGTGATLWSLAKGGKTTPAPATNSPFTTRPDLAPEFSPQGSAPPAETSIFGAQTAAETGAAGGSGTGTLAAEGANYSPSPGYFPTGGTEGVSYGAGAYGAAGGQIVSGLGAGYGAGKAVGTPLGKFLFPSGSNFAQSSGGGMIAGGIAGTAAAGGIGGVLGMIGGAMSGVGVKGRPNPIPLQPGSDWSTDWRDWSPSRQIGWNQDPSGTLVGTDNRLYSKNPDYDNFELHPYHSGLVNLAGTYDEYLENMQRHNVPGSAISKDQFNQWKASWRPDQVGV